MDLQVKQFVNARKEFIGALDRFPEDKRDDVLFGKWTLKDVVAHFTGWDIFCVGTLKLLEKGEPASYWGDVDKFNEEVVEKSKESNWNKIYKQFMKTGEQFIREYSNIPVQLQNKLIWPSKSYTPAKLLRINIHHYEKAQLKEIKRFLAKWRS